MKIPRPTLLGADKRYSPRAGASESVADREGHPRISRGAKDTLVAGGTAKNDTPEKKAYVNACCAKEAIIRQSKQMVEAHSEIAGLGGRASDARIEICQVGGKRNLGGRRRTKASTSHSFHWSLCGARRDTELGSCWSCASHQG